MTAIGLASCAAPTAAPQPDSEATSTVSILAAEIAYQWLVSGGGDGIWVTNTGAGQSRELFADLPGEQRHPEWSPDGNYIAFIESDAGHDDVWLSKADGSDPAPLAACEGSCLGYDFVAWTPNGEHLVAMAYAGPPSPNGPPGSSSLSKDTAAYSNGRRGAVSHDCRPQGSDAQGRAWSGHLRAHQAAIVIGRPLRGTIAT